MTRIKKGDRVLIYEDPVTQQSLEGKARVVSVSDRVEPIAGASGRDAAMYFATVVFSGSDEGPVRRWVKGPR